MEELNELVAAGDARDDRRRIFGRPLTVGQHFEIEAPTLRPLPATPFDPTLMLRPRVDGKSRVCVRRCFYSVPVRFAGGRIDVRLGAERVEALNGKSVVADHARAVAKGSEVLVLDHYLAVFRIKPGAFPGATALGLARASGAFTATHDEFRALARDKLGDAAGTRALIKVLLLHRTVPRDFLLAGMRAAWPSARSTPRSWPSRPARLPAERSPRWSPSGRCPATTGRSPPSTATTPCWRPARDRHDRHGRTGRHWRRCRELHLPTVRGEASRLAEVAQRNRLSYLAFLAEILSAEVDDRAERRSERRYTTPGSRASSLCRLRPGRRADSEPGHDRDVGERLLPRCRRSRRPPR